MARTHLPSLRLSPAKAAGATEMPSLARQKRHHMIEVAAYYRAERRGFNGGDPVADWLDAEVHVDAALDDELQ